MSIPLTFFEKKVRPKNFNVCCRRFLCCQEFSPDSSQAAGGNSCRHSKMEFFQLLSSRLLKKP